MIVFGVLEQKLVFWSPLFEELKHLVKDQACLVVPAQLHVGSTYITPRRFKSDLVIYSYISGLNGLMRVLAEFEACKPEPDAICSLANTNDVTYYSCKVLHVTEKGFRFGRSLHVFGLRQDNLLYRAECGIAIVKLACVPLGTNVA